MATWRGEVSGGLRAADLQFVRELLLERAGIVIERDKDYFIEMRLATLAAEERYAGSLELVEAVRASDPGAAIRRRVVESMTISETSFFRDLHPFEALRDHVLPRLAASPSERPARIWSAACATGQEAYSVALLVIEHFPGLAARGLRIIATDLSQPTLQRAAIGRYSQAEMNRGLPVQYLVRYFRKDGPDWVVKDDVRRLLEFQELNLSATWPIQPRFDVVLLRNALIYFADDVRRRVLDRITGVLAPDGLLLVGSGEGHFATAAGFDPVTLGRTQAFRIHPHADRGDQP